MALSLSLEDILIKAPTEAAAFAGGLAIHPALAPLLRDLENFTWSEHPDKALDLLTAAAVAAEDVAQYDTMAQEAKYGGYDAARFQWAYGETLNAPGVGELLTLLRRQSEAPIDFAHGLRKAKLEAQWDDALRNLRDLRIPGPDLAYMVVRGVVPDGGTLPSALPTQSDRLSLPPQLSLDTIAEASKTGWDAERFAALVARSGLAMAPVMAAQANFRGILSDNDYLLTIARGDLFPAYAGPVLEVSRQILTAGEYAELQLRGFLDEPTRRSKTAQHGMTTSDSDLLYDLLGRGVSVHQVLIGERRGGVYGGPIDQIPAAYLAALRRGNLRPEFYNLAYAARETFPSYFVTRSLLQSGAITSERGAELFAGLGWPLDVAQSAATLFGGGATATTDPHVTKAENQLWTTLHRSYVAEETDDATATTTLGTLGVAAAAVPQILALWEQERALIRKQLTPAQVKKAYKGLVTNPETGTAWTLEDALAALIARGYSMNDATTFLEL